MCSALGLDVAKGQMKGVPNEVHFHLRQHLELQRTNPTRTLEKMKTNKIKINKNFTPWGV